MADSLVRVDEQVFRAHLEAGPFQSGLDRGRWRLLFLDWPFALIAVKAAERDSGAGRVHSAFRVQQLSYGATNGSTVGHRDRHTAFLSLLAKRQKARLSRL